METPQSPETLPPLSSKEVLAGLIAIVCPLLIVIQVVIFCGFRWEKMEFRLWPAGTREEWSLSPWVVWLPIFALIMGAMVWWMNRTMPVSRLIKWAIGLSAFVGIGFAVWGLLLSPPPAHDFIPADAAQSPLRLDPWSQNPFRQ